MQLGLIICVVMNLEEIPYIHLHYMPEKRLRAVTQKLSARFSHDPSTTSTYTYNTTTQSTTINTYLSTWGLN